MFLRSSLVIFCLSVRIAPAFITGTLSEEKHLSNQISLDGLKGINQVTGFKSKLKDTKEEPGCGGCIGGGKNCCAYSHADRDPEDVAAYKCPQLIVQSDQLTVERSQQFGLDCFPNDLCGSIARCTWKLPSGRVCDFDSKADAGSACQSDPDVILNGSPKTGSCSIIVKSADAGLHNGQWKCRTYFETTYTDFVNITVDSSIANRPVTLSAGTIMGITIPLGILLIVLVVIVLICCFCPMCCPIWLRCGGKRYANDHETASGCCGGRKRGNKPKDVHYTEPQRPPRAMPAPASHPPTVLPPPPPHRLRDVHAEQHRQQLQQQQQQQLQHQHRQSRHQQFEIYEDDENTDSTFQEAPARPGQRKPGYQAQNGFNHHPQIEVDDNFDQITYTRAETGLVVPGVQQTRTARKISNTTSLHSFGPTTAKTERAKKFSAM